MRWRSCPRSRSSPRLAWGAGPGAHREPDAGVFSAGASLTSSPIARGRSRPHRRLHPAASSSLIASNCAPLMTVPPMPSWRAIAAAVTAIAGDHADPDPGGLGLRDRRPGGGARRVDDPDQGEQLQVGHEREHLGTGIEGCRVEVPAGGGHDPQALFREPLVLGQVQLAEAAVDGACRRPGPVS